MSAPFTKDQLAFSLGNASYIGPRYEDVPERPVAMPGSFGRWIAARIVAIRAWFEKQAVLREMEEMGDHELADIGLTRSDVRRVFDAGFVADLPRGRNYIAY